MEGAGDVAFIKHTIVGENSDGKRPTLASCLINVSIVSYKTKALIPPPLVKGNGPSWASNVRSADYELICPGLGPVPVTDFLSCNLAKVPAHAVVTRPESRTEVITILQDQQVSDQFSLLVFGCLLSKIWTRIINSVHFGEACFCPIL